MDQYGGKFIVRGDATEKVEGDWDPKRLVILEFESVQRAREWYHSQECSGPIKLRHQSARTNLIFFVVAGASSKAGTAGLAEPANPRKLPLQTTVRGDLNTYEVSTSSPSQPIRLERGTR